MNPDRHQLQALADHLATDPTRVAARADHRARIRRGILARLLAPVRVPRSESQD